MAGAFTLGDVIRKARVARRWNQTRLGAEAAKYPLRASDVAINKSTVSKVEKDPYTSEFGTVWRLLTALRLKFSDVEKRVGQPFIDAIRQSAVSGSDTGGVRPTRVSNDSDGRSFATSLSTPDDGEDPSVLGEARPRGGNLRAHVKRAVAAVKQDEAVVAAQAARAARQPAAAARSKAPSRRVRDRNHHR